MGFYRHSRHRKPKTAVLQGISAVPIAVPILMKEQWERSRLYHGVSIRKYGTRIVILPAGFSGTIACMTQLSAPGCAGLRMQSCADIPPQQTISLCRSVCLCLFFPIRAYTCVCVPVLSIIYILYALDGFL